MLRLTVGIFGDKELTSLGKKGTENDIAIFNHNSSEAAINFVSVEGEKIQSLLQTIAMIDIPLFHLKELTPKIGEQIIALDLFDFKKGFIISNNLDVIKGTSLENYTLITKDDVRNKILEVDIERKDEPVRVDIDNYFHVKGVGFVLLGVVKSGSVRKHDKLMVEPLGKEIIVKSIQSNDKDVEIAEKGTRVGINVKGVTIEEMKRGFVICDNVKKAKKLTLKLIKSKFFKEELKEEEQIGVLSGLMFTTGIIEKINGNKITIIFEKEIVYDKDIIIASTKNKLPRIIGKGKIYQ